MGWNWYKNHTNGLSSGIPYYLIISIEIIFSKHAQKVPKIRKLDLFQKLSVEGYSFITISSTKLQMVLKKKLLTISFKKMTKNPNKQNRRCLKKNKNWWNCYKHHDNFFFQLNFHLNSSKAVKMIEIVKHIIKL